MFRRHGFSIRMCRLGLALLASACDEGSDVDGDDDSSPVTCAQRSGTYSTTYVERSGNCGPQAEAVSTIQKQPVDVVMDVPPCISGQILYSADNCEVTNVNIVCPVDAVEAGATSTYNGKYDWDAAGDRGTGTLSLAVDDADGQRICESSYDVTSVRL